MYEIQKGKTLEAIVQKRGGHHKSLDINGFKTSMQWSMAVRSMA